MSRHSCKHDCINSSGKRSCNTDTNSDSRLNQAQSSAQKPSGTTTKYTITDAWNEVQITDRGGLSHTEAVELNVVTVTCKDGRVLVERGSGVEKSPEIRLERTDEELPPDGMPSMSSRNGPYVGDVPLSSSSSDGEEFMDREELMVKSTKMSRACEDQSPSIPIDVVPRMSVSDGTSGVSDLMPELNCFLADEHSDNNSSATRHEHMMIDALAWSVSVEKEILKDGHHSVHDELSTANHSQVVQEGKTQHVTDDMDVSDEQVELPLLDSAHGHSGVSFVPPMHSADSFSKTITADTVRGSRIVPSASTPHDESIMNQNSESCLTESSTTSNAFENGNALVDRRLELLTHGTSSSSNGREGTTTGHKDSDCHNPLVPQTKSGETINYAISPETDSVQPMNMQLVGTSDHLALSCMADQHNQHQRWREKLQTLMEALNAVLKTLRSLLKVRSVDDDVARTLVDAQRELVFLEDLVWKVRDASEKYGYYGGIKESLEDLAVTLLCIEELYRRQDLLIQELLKANHGNFEGDHVWPASIRAIFSKDHMCMQIEQTNTELLREITVLRMVPVTGPESMEEQITCSDVQNDNTRQENYVSLSNSVVVGNNEGHAKTGDENIVDDRALLPVAKHRLENVSCSSDADQETPLEVTSSSTTDEVDDVIDGALHEDHRPIINPDGTDVLPWRSPEWFRELDMPLPIACLLGGMALFFMVFILIWLCYGISNLFLMPFRGPSTCGSTGWFSGGGGGAGSHYSRANCPPTYVDVWHWNIPFLQLPRMNPGPVL